MKFWPILLFLVSCTDVNQKLDTKVAYKKDIKLVYEGREYNGVGVLPESAKYKLDLTFPGQVDLFKFTTCHREVTQEEAGGSGIFGKKNRVTFTYEPVPGIESGKYCQVSITGLEQKDGRHSFGLFDFQSPEHLLPAIVSCNGRTENFRGVSICQSLTGLIQRIKFARKTSVMVYKDCPKPITTDGHTFSYFQGRDRCVYDFKSLDEPSDRHRFTTYGWDEIPIRSID